MFFKSRTATVALSRACRNVIQIRPAQKSFRFVLEQLEDRRLLSGTAPALAASTTVLPFNASVPGNAYSGPSRVESVTLTNNGSGFLLFDSGAFSIVGNPNATTSTPSAFAITNSSSLPTQLAPGQSAVVDLQYTPTIVGLQEAILDINTNDPTTPTFAINLNGIGTAGEFGTTEPSLVQVLRSYNIPTIVGAGPNDININTQKYPANPDPSSQEVPMQRLVAANPSQPVTITPIASFSSATPAISRIGYYTPGNPNSKTELFHIAEADAQTVDPTAVGATSFEPGSAAFSLYGTFPGTTTSNGSLDTHYSEDSLNVLDPSSPRKIRFFPLETANGTVVPNTFVVAIEDYDNPSAYNSFINFDGIISNVQAAPNATAGSVPSSTTGHNPAVMGIQENETAPSSNVLVFNTIFKPNSVVADVVHNTNTITINNTGDQPLTITSLVLSDTKNWALVNPPAAGTQIAGGSSLTVTIKFIATTDPAHSTNETNDTTSLSDVSSIAAGGVWSGTLTINSNASTNPTSTVKLAGYWQIQSEHENEPSLSTLTNLMFGYTSNVAGSTSTDGTQYPNSGNTVINYASEVDPTTDQGLFIAADPSQPVSIIEAAAYHQQYVTVSATVGTVGEAVESESEDANNNVTITTDAATTFAVGNSVTIAGDISGYNGTFTITSVPTANSFTYVDTVSNLDPTTTAATTPKTGWYVPGAKTKYLYSDQPNNGQSVFPLLNNVSYSTVQNSFTPTGAFGLNLDGEKSQDSANTDNLPFNTSEHGVRFFPVIDANGNTVPNTYLACLDYRAYATPNSDYQDLYEIVSNVTFEALPATPIDLQATEGTSGVNLQWAPIAGATGYNVYQVINGTKTLLTANPITASSYVDTTAPTNTSIQYQVTAVNAAKKESPADVAVISVAASIPSSPTIQSADGSSGTHVAVVWSPVAAATSYVLSREGPGQTTFTPIASGLTGTTYSDTAVIAGDNYNYVVQAQNSAGLSPNSAPVTANVTGSMPTLSAPNIILVDGTSGTQVSLSWTSVSNATSYTVERESQGQSSFTILATGLGTTSYADSAVTPGATYEYVISAQNGSTTSPLSAPATATVASKVATLTAPTNLAANTSSGTSIALTWSASSGASTYNVDRESPGSSSFQQIATGLTATSYTDSSVIPGDGYVYAVQAVNGSNFSALSTPPVSAMLPSKSGNVLVTVGKGTNKFIEFTDLNGTLVVIKMTGLGVATVDFTGDSLVPSTIKSGIAIVNGTNISVAGISTTDTSSNSGLNITTKGGNGTVSLGSVTVDASIGNITAKTATLVGGLSVVGSINRISLGSANVASISVGGTLGTLQVAAATSLNLTSSGPIKNITAGTFNSSVITAPSIGAVTIKGNANFNANTAAIRSLHVRGILSDSTLTLTGGGIIDLASLSAGAIQNSTINATGNLGSISAGQLSNSVIDAGVASTATLPSATSDFSASSFINSVNLKKIAGSDSDVNSSIAASLVKHASLGYVQFANGDVPFGIAAEAANSVTFADPAVGKSYTFTKLLIESTVSADFVAKGITPQDFVIRIV